MYLIFDTETTGFPIDREAPISNTDNWPRMVQIAWQLHGEMGELLEVKNFIIRPEGYDIPYNAERVHGISTQMATDMGVELDFALQEFALAIKKSKFAVGHNIGFDIPVVLCEYYRKQRQNDLDKLLTLDTCTEETAKLCQLGGGGGRRFKLPKLMELHRFLFGEDFDAAHNAAADVEATGRSFLELVRRGHFSSGELKADGEYIQRFQAANPSPIKAIGLNTQPYGTEQKKKEEKDTSSNATGNTSTVDIGSLRYSHLHNHTQFSVLQATSQVEELVGTAYKEQMAAVGISDFGNMYGAFNFVLEVSKANQKIDAHNQKVNSGEINAPLREHIKAVVGCELYVAENYKQLKFTKDQPDRRFSQVLFAKNKIGYHHLAKLSTAGHTEGLYGLYPRISKELIVEHRDGLIATTGGLQGEVPSLILQVGERQAEAAFVWWKEAFGDDFYVELLRHGLPENDRVNRTLLAFAERHNVRYIAQNNTFYCTQEDSNAHDILLCIRDGEIQSKPIGYGREFRFGFPNNEFYFKSQDQMRALFADLPKAIENIQHLVDKIENYKLAKDVLLPAFDIPQEFVDPLDATDGGKRGENAYLRHLTYIGAEKLYGDISDDLSERIDFELETIRKTGYPGYFLIVQDFTTEARKIGVSVGPGRGSAAGSVVAYCIGITAIDPVKYDLLFERFLNPERVSLPDIDIDFDDEGRGAVIDYVVRKYGQNQVAQIITYGTLAAKNAIRDTARVMEYTPTQINEMSKLVPEISLAKLFTLPEDKLKEKLKNRSEEIEKAHYLKSISQGNDTTANIINQAKIIEGSIKSLGVHACGVIITPSDIREHVPVATAKDSDMLVTQFDNKVVESAGLLKMDFLGLKTLTLIRNTIDLVRERLHIDIDTDQIPINDIKTYELFQRGDTVGIFQYESAGMQKYMKDLRPTTFSDLIAMNALYRPGPLEYIPSFIRRKRGQEEIVYDLPDMEEYLAETYGITVYQEQVMLLSQKLAGFTKGEADVLRKAMGKKQIEVLNKMKSKFITQASEKGHPADKLDKIWKDWEAFAQYAFNKSHSTCYAWIAYQTAYLKANFPAEYMAAVVSNNMNDIKDVSFYMEETRRMGINILCPDVNESGRKFTVNRAGDIRFGLGAVKNVGDNAIAFILKDRTENGPYKSLYDFTSRVDKSSCSRRTLEHFVLCGAFDSFGYNRSQYFAQDGKMSVLERAVRYGEALRESQNSAQSSLFGDEISGDDSSISAPVIPYVEEWVDLEKLKKEREIVGLFISGHPLDQYSFVLDHYCSVKIEQLQNIDSLIGRTLTFGGIITKSEQGISKNGNAYGRYTIEDQNNAYEFALFDTQFAQFNPFMGENSFVQLQVRVREGWLNKNTNQLGKPRLEFLSVQLLSEVPKNNHKKITISLSISDINQAVVDALYEIISQHPGINPIDIQVYDPDSGVRMDMPIHTYKIELSQHIIDSLQELSSKDILIQ